MAAVVRCDSCGAVVPHTKAIHAKFYPMNSATSYRENDLKMIADLCDCCYKRFVGSFKQEAK